MPLQSHPDQPLIGRVIADDLCIACGACVAICPRANLRPAFHEGRGAEEVEIIAPDRCQGCPQPCDSVCPSIEVDFARNRAAVQGPDAAPGGPPARDGWLESIHLGWSPEFRDDGVSSSGGIIRAFVAQALGSGTPVVCLAAEPAGAAFRPRLLSAPGQLGDVPGSIYHSTSFAGAIELIRAAPAPVLLVAIPCQLQGILNYIDRQDGALAGRIRLICGIICGWMYSFHALRAFARFRGIAGAQPARTTYRGGDRVGRLRIPTEAGARSFARRDFGSWREAIDYRSSFSTDYNRLRCRLCEDHLNLGADVVVGDAWLARNGARKASIIGCRTPRGQRALAALAGAGLLQLEPASFADLVESQSWNLAFGARARQRNRLIRAGGGVAPLFRFSDADAPVSAGIRCRLSAAAERVRRRLVRAGHYGLYRWYYRLRHLPLALRRIARALARRPRP